MRLIDKSILKLEALIQWFNNQSKWIFSSSSLLIVYDGDLTANNEMELKMIDFTHVYESKIVHKSIQDSDANFKDENTIYGLNSLLNNLKQLRLDLVNNN